MVETTTASLFVVLLFNLALLIVVVLLFSIIRQIRGDKAKVKITQTLAQQVGIKDNDLETVLLNPSNCK